MRSDKRIKLKLSTSNARNFPKDFFEDTTIIDKRYTAKPSLANMSIWVAEPSKALKPLKIIDKSNRMWSPIINPRKLREVSIDGVSSWDPENSFNQTIIDANINNRHQKIKSLSLRTHKNIDSVTRILKSSRKELKLKHSFVLPLKLKAFLKDSEKSISTAESLGETTIMQNKNNFGKTKRSKSIQKKSLINRRNLQHLMNTRQKATYSANNSILFNISNRKDVQNEDAAISNFRLDDNRLYNIGYMSVVQQRNKQQIKPFILIPFENQQAHTKNETRNNQHREEFTLPSIFSKESLYHSDAESEHSIFDIECDKSTNDSPTPSPIKPLSSWNQSNFLLKLERSLFKTPNQENPTSLWMTTAYFGADSIK